MGEAKRRGDYEKRRAEAIGAGRVKKPKFKNALPPESIIPLIGQVLIRRSRK